jgi:hypothetical protein
MGISSNFPLPVLKAQEIYLANITVFVYIPPAGDLAFFVSRNVLSID